MTAPSHGAVSSAGGFHVKEVATGPGTRGRQDADRRRFAELVAFDRALAERFGEVGRSCRAGPLFPGMLPRLAGFDEAGRGALAGPVVVGCVSLPAGGLLGGDRIAGWIGVDDSKRLTARRRETLFARITAEAAWAVGCASAREIDRVGIVAACDVATRRAFERLKADPQLALLDRGLSLERALSCSGNAGCIPEQALTRGDSTSLHIAAASIVAKVFRDALMCRLDPVEPGYEFGIHKGYGTRGHRNLVALRGPSRLHRLSFLHLERKR